MWQLLAPMIGPIIDKVVDRIPNVNDRAEAKENFKKQLAGAVTNANAAQAKINEVEAAHRSIFVAGWRPFVGWVCGVSIAWSFMIQPIISWALVVFGDSTSTLPALETDGLFQLVTAMLGMGGLRTFEKMKGVARVK